MTDTIITQGKATISLPVPPEYIGRRIEVTFNLLDETEKPKPKPEQKLSEMFRGVFSKEDAESFREHINKMRGEWDT
jgi:hypothetical protein